MRLGKAGGKNGDPKAKAIPPTKAALQDAKARKLVQDVEDHNGQIEALRTTVARLQDNVMKLEHDLVALTEAVESNGTKTTKIRQDVDQLMRPAPARQSINVPHIVDDDDVKPVGGG